MKNREFIELLNLYVDHEISPEDALRLEAEVLSNPERRKVYQQYCRMQKACSQLAETLAVQGDDSKVVAFPVQRRSAWMPVSLGLAAAACAAFVFAFHNSPQEAKVAVAAAAPAPSIKPAAAATDEMKPVFVASTTVRFNSAAQFTSADTAQQMAPLNWIGNLHMTPVYATPNPAFPFQGKVELKPSVLADSQSDRDDGEPTEMTAFRFQR